MFVMVAVYAVIVPIVLVDVEVTIGILMKLEQNEAAWGYTCRTFTMASTFLHTWAGGRAGFGRAETAAHMRKERDS